MKLLVTGGNRGLGKSLCDATGGISLSRSNGFDIASPEGRKKIAERTLDADVFVNNAFDGPPQEAHADLGQARLLKEVFLLWSASRKPGYIINIGSISSFYTVKKYNSFEMYRVAKIALDQASFACTRAFFANEVPFRTSLIRFGRLDTPFNRSKETWKGQGHDLSHITDCIISLAQSPPATCAFSIDFDTKLE